MATPRSLLVDPIAPLYYHITSRCVQRAWLLGPDPLTGEDFSHRRKWVINRIKHLGRFFAIEIAAYAIMSNHFHLVLFFDPGASSRWTDEEVARRWVDAFPTLVEGSIDLGMQELRYQVILEDPSLLAATRRKLGDLSCFMKHLKQPISWRANQEAGTDGNFWANRFYSGALLDEDAVLAAMAYVDLNPVRAKIARNIEECQDTSVFERMKDAKHSKEKLDAYLEPIVSGLNSNAEKKTVRSLPLTLAAYLKRLQNTCDYIHLGVPQPSKLSATDRWVSHIKTLGRRQRAYGQNNVLEIWLGTRSMRRLESPLSGNTE